MKLDRPVRIIRLLVLVSLSVIGYGISLVSFAAEINSFEEFRGHCGKENILDEVDQEALPHRLKEGFQKEVCESYIRGYLAVANHNCKLTRRWRDYLLGSELTMHVMMLLGKRSQHDYRLRLKG